MKRPTRRWHLYSDRTGYHTPPTALDWDAYRQLTKSRHIERSGDGCWAELIDQDGTIAAVLVRFDLATKVEAA